MNPRCISSPMAPSIAQVAGTLTVVPTLGNGVRSCFLLLADCISVASMHHATSFLFLKKLPSSIGFLSTWDLSSPSPLALPFRCSTISVAHPSIRVQCGLRISTKGNLRQHCQSATLLSTSTVLRAASGKVTKHSREAAHCTYSRRASL